jgi:hypothetical protein
MSEKIQVGQRNEVLQTQFRPWTAGGDDWFLVGASPTLPAHTKQYNCSGVRVCVRHFPVTPPS